MRIDGPPAWGILPVPPGHESSGQQADKWRKNDPTADVEPNGSQQAQAATEVNPRKQLPLSNKEYDRVETSPLTRLSYNAQLIRHLLAQAPRPASRTAEERRGGPLASQSDEVSTGNHVA